jgi:glyoxylase-like metal-dependent hydrolase (beta-lactamase superfamily II)
MLIHASGQIYPDFFLLTFGGSCQYAIKKEDGCLLFDPGLSIHIPYLYKRMEMELHKQPDQIKEIFITHLHPERVAAIPYLKQRSEIVLYGSSLMQEKLNDESFVRDIYDQDQEICALYDLDSTVQPLSFEDFYAALKIDTVFPDSEVFQINENIRVRCVKAEGHTEESFAFVVEPYDFVVVDEGFGYFRGKELAAPGGDWSLEKSLTTIRYFNDVEISAICFPNIGMITGHLVRTHLQSILDSYEDLIKESKKQDLPVEEKVATLKKTFYSSFSRDPLVHYALERTFQAVLKQLGLVAEESCEGSEE